MWFNFCDKSEICIATNTSRTNWYTCRLIDQSKTPGSSKGSSAYGTTSWVSDVCKNCQSFPILFLTYFAKYFSLMQCILQGLWFQAMVCTDWVLRWHLSSTLRKHKIIQTFLRKVKKYTWFIRTVILYSYSCASVMYFGTCFVHNYGWDTALNGILVVPSKISLTLIFPHFLGPSTVNLKADI